MVGELVVCGTHFCDGDAELAERDIERLEIEREDEIMQEKPGIVLLKDIAKLWPADATFVETQWLVGELVRLHPEMWGAASSFGKKLTMQRLGRMLVKNFNIHSDRPDTNGPRGYLLVTLRPVFIHFGVGHLTPLPWEPDDPAEPAEPEGQLPIQAPA